MFLPENVLDKLLSKLEIVQLTGAHEFRVFCCIARRGHFLDNFIEK